jgi:hypothetical protein
VIVFIWVLGTIELFCPNKNERRSLAPAAEGAEGAQ